LPARSAGGQARRPTGVMRDNRTATAAGAITTATAAERENRDTGALQSDAEQAI